METIIRSLLSSATLNNQTTFSDSGFRHLVLYHLFLEKMRTSAGQALQLHSTEEAID